MIIPFIDSSDAGILVIASCSSASKTSPVGFTTSSPFWLNTLFSLLYTKVTPSLNASEVFSSSAASFARSKSSNTGSSFETLTPRQRLSAVPYAVKSEISDITEFAYTARTAEKALDLSISNTSINDALIFNGTRWHSKPQQWLEVGDEYSVNNKKVSIGANSGTGRLSVSSDGSETYAFNVYANSGSEGFFVHQNTQTLGRGGNYDCLNRDLNPLRLDPVSSALTTRPHPNFFAY